MNLTLHVWRQPGASASGRFVRYDVAGVAPEMSFLEMLDALNERLANAGEHPIAFDSDCREGICGACGFVINGVAHGPLAGGTVCQLHLRWFHDGDELWLEPWRARAFPVVRDLIVDRGALDRVVAAGGFITAPTGGAPEANAVPVPKPDAEAAMDAAACIGCGALRRGVPERVGVAVHVRQAGAPRAPAAGAARARHACSGNGRAGRTRGLRRLQ